MEMSKPMRSAAQRPRGVESRGAARIEARGERRDKARGPGGEREECVSEGESGTAWTVLLFPAVLNTTRRAGKGKRRLSPAKLGCCAGGCPGGGWGVAGALTPRRAVFSENVCHNVWSLPVPCPLSVLRE
eukprot:scaffold124474_cov69-Phaeocystis_antarctica.AAC.2